MKPVRLSYEGLLVLQLLLKGAPARSGGDIIRGTGLSRGTVYTMLARFARAGVLTSTWEKASPQELGRPRQRFYTLTKAGRTLARTTLATLR